MESNLYEYYKNKKGSLNIDKIKAIGHDILEATHFIH